MTRIEPRRPPVVRTPARRPNQWLRSGEMLELLIPCSGCGWYPEACQCRPRHRQDEEAEDLHEQDDGELTESEET